MVNFYFLGIGGFISDAVGLAQRAAHEASISILRFAVNHFSRLNRLTPAKRLREKKFGMANWRAVCPPWAIIN